MPDHGLVAEIFDLGLAHAGEIVPLLVVLAGVAQAEPKIVGKPLAALGDAISAFLLAALDGASAHFRRRHEVRFDPDVAPKAR